MTLTSRSVGVAAAAFIGPLLVTGAASGTPISATPSADPFPISSPGWLSAGAAPLEFAEARNEYPAIRTAADGSQVAVWLERTPGRARIVTSVRAPAGAWSAPQAVSVGSQAESPVFDMNDRGQAVAAWLKPLGRLRAVLNVRTRSASGKWSAVRTLRYGKDLAVTPNVAIAPNGEAAVTWIAKNPATGYFINAQVATAKPGGPWRRADVMPRFQGEYIAHPTVAYDGRSRPVVLWSGGLHSNIPVMSSSRIGSRWAPGRMITRVRGGAAEFVPVRMKDGALRLTLARGTKTDVFTRTRAGAWKKATRNVTPRPAQSAYVTHGPNGNAVTIATVGTGAVANLQARFLRTGSRTWSAPVTLFRGRYIDSKVSFGKDGTASIVWIGATKLDEHSNPTETTAYARSVSPTGKWSEPSQIHIYEHPANGGYVRVGPVVSGHRSWATATLIPYINNRNGRARQVGILAIDNPIGVR